MGANEERIKNLRKKEQIDRMMKNRSNNNSKSIQNRIKIENKSEKNENLDLRSKSRQRDIKSALIKKNSSKIILNDTKYIDMTNAYKDTTSKDTINNNNIEDMISNINLMNKNIASNLNKITVDSPSNKRRRNEVKYNLTNFPSSKFFFKKKAGREKSETNSKILIKINENMQSTDEYNKENESKNININLKDYNLAKKKNSSKNTIDDLSVIKKVNHNTEGVEEVNENLFSDSSINNHFNKCKFKPTYISN